MKAIRGLHAVLHLGLNESGEAEGSGIRDYFIHSSFAEFLQDPNLSLEFAIDSQKSYKRLLSGCLDSMLPLGLDTNVQSSDAQRHVRFALTAWPTLWSYTTWETSEEAECLRQIDKLMNIDLTACFFHWLHTEPLKGSGQIHLTPVRMVYLAQQKNVLSKARGVPAAAVQGLTSYARSSIDAALNYMLQPENLHKLPLEGTVFPNEFAYILMDLWWHRSPTYKDYLSHSIVKTLHAIWSDPEQKDVFERLKKAQQRVISGIAAVRPLDFDHIISNPQEPLQMANGSYKWGGVGYY
jgi:hypothetical protein